MSYRHHWGTYSDDFRGEHRRFRAHALFAGAQLDLFMDHIAIEVYHLRPSEGRPAAGVEWRTWGVYILYREAW